jgi:hypothetical protein
VTIAVTAAINLLQRGGMKATKAAPTRGSSQRIVRGIRRL